MNVGINATCMTRRSSGATQRFKGLYGPLFDRLPNFKFVVYEPLDCNVRDWFAARDNVRFVRTPLLSENPAQRFIRGLLFWPKEIKANKFQIFESLNFPIIDTRPGHNLLTIHDIRDLKLNHNIIRRILFRLALGDSIKKAKKIIAVSESTRSEILEYFPNANVSVVYNGIDERRFSEINPYTLTETKIRLNLPDNFILAVGHFEARKNYTTLIDAFARLRLAGHNIDLVIVGNDSGTVEEVVSCAMSKNVRGRVHIILRSTDADVLCIYKLANALVFPSTYEGFGIPLLEAMASGIPMTVSDIPIFKEITEGCGNYFDPLDSESMSAALLNVIYSLPERERLIGYGKKRIAEFSFLKLSSDMANLYNQLL